MSNNPGKKGHPAPWVKRERADRARALEEYCTQHHAGYRAWRKARHEVWRKAHAEAEAAFPGPALIGSVLKHEEKLLKAWESYVWNWVMTV